MLVGTSIVVVVAAGEVVVVVASAVGAFGTVVDVVVVVVDVVVDDDVLVVVLIELVVVATCVVVVVELLVVLAGVVVVVELGVVVGPWVVAGLTAEPFRDWALTVVEVRGVVVGTAVVLADVVDGAVDRTERPSWFAGTDVAVLWSGRLTLVRGSIAGIVVAAVGSTGVGTKESVAVGCP